MLTGDFTPAGSAGLGWSFFISVVVLGFGWAGAIAWILASSFRLRRLQEHENAYMHERATWRLSPGPSRVVYGRVQVDGDAPVALELDIHQVVENVTQKKARWHLWNEVFREMKTQPFKLAHADGATVLVEAGKDAFIVDSLATSYPPTKPSMRVRSATVRQDEEVFVYGDLHAGPGGGAYRGGDTFVLRPPRGGRILVATEAMRERYVERARHLRDAAILLGALFLILHVFMAPFALAVMFGKQEVATVINAHSYVTRGKGGATTHYVLRARASDGFTLEDEVSATMYTAARSMSAREAVTIPIIRTGSSQWASYLGTEANMSIVLLIVGLVIGIGSTSFVLGTAAGKLAWYDRKKVIERGGDGHWIETRTVDGKGPPIEPDRT